MTSDGQNSTLQEFEHGLLIGIGLGQDCRCRLLNDLRSGHLTGRFGIVCIQNAAARSLRVGCNIGQVVRCVGQSIGNGTQAGPECIHGRDGLIQYRNGGLRPFINQFLAADAQGTRVKCLHRDGDDIIGAVRLAVLTADRLIAELNRKAGE